MRYIYNNLNGVRKIRTKARSLAIGVSTTVAAVAMAIGMPLAAHAASSQVVVTPPLNTQGWSTADTRPGGAVSFNNDTSAPGVPHNGALTLITTDATAKAQYLHGTNAPLSDVTELSYYTKQNTASFIGGDASYQLPVCLTGVTGTACNPGLTGTTNTDSFNTLVFEPYYNPTQGPVIPGTWQQWDVDSGLFWASRTVVCENGTLVGTPGGPASYTLAQVKAFCPNAVVNAFGVNVGSGNPGYNVEADLVNFNGTTYNFEPFAAVTDKDQCKNGGWMTAKDADGNGFKNQGQCVAYTNRG